jgi:hypothetical protein
MNTLTETQERCIPTGATPYLPVPEKLLIKIGRDCICMIAVVAFAAIATLVFGLQGSSKNNFTFSNADASRPAALQKLEMREYYSAFAPYRTSTPIRENTN